MDKKNPVLLAKLTIGGGLGALLLFPMFYLMGLVGHYPVGPFIATRVVVFVVSVSLAFAFFGWCGQAVGRVLLKHARTRGLPATTLRFDCALVGAMFGFSLVLDLLGGWVHLW